MMQDVPAPQANTGQTMRLDLGDLPQAWTTGPAWFPGTADLAVASDGSRLVAMGGDAQGGGFFDPTNGVYELSLAACLPARGLPWLLRCPLLARGIQQDSLQAASLMATSGQQAVSTAQQY